MSLKLSQGAKPGIGGVLPAAKVTGRSPRRAASRRAQKCVSPAAHKVFSTPRELVQFIAQMRELAGGKPTGFKLCVGSRRELLAICKAMVDGGHHAGLHHRRRLRGRHRRGAAGVRGPRRHAADRGPDDRAQRPGRRRAARPGQDRRQRQGRHRQRHRQAARPGRRLHQRGPGDDDGGRLHPGPEVPHQHVPGRRRHPGPAPGPRPRRRATRPSASTASSRPPSPQALQIIASMGLDRPARAAPTCLRRRVDHDRHRAATPSCYHWLEPGELLADAPEPGPPTGPPPTPTASAPRTSDGSALPRRPPHDHRRRTARRRARRPRRAHRVGRRRRRAQPGHRRHPPRGPRSSGSASATRRPPRSPPARRPS